MTAHADNLLDILQRARREQIKMLNVEHEYSPNTRYVCVKCGDANEYASQHKRTEQ